MDFHRLSLAFPVWTILASEATIIEWASLSFPRAWSSAARTRWAAVGAKVPSIRWERGEVGDPVDVRFNRVMNH